MQTIKVRKISNTNYDNKKVLKIYINQRCTDSTKVTYYSPKELINEINNSGAYAVRLVGTHKVDCNSVQHSLEKCGIRKVFLYSKKWED